MKKSSLIIMIVVFLSLCINGIQGQTTQTKLNQVELMKQFLGTWKGDELAKDTTIITDITPFGTIIEENYQIVTKGKILDSGKQLWGYDKENDKLITAQVSISSSNIYIMAFWWSSKNTFEGVQFQDISNPENATLKWKIEFKSPELFVMTTIQNNKVIAVYSYAREKK
jgi:hypothetical protein